MGTSKGSNAFARGARATSRSLELVTPACAGKETVRQAQTIMIHVKIWERPCLSEAWIGHSSAKFPRDCALPRDDGSKRAALEHFFVAQVPNSGHADTPQMPYARHPIRGRRNSERGPS